jgi:DNA replication and repair protein RecF
LKQRNSLLRHAKIDPLQLSIWDNELCGLAEKVTLARQRYLEKLMPVLMEVVSYFHLELDFSFQFYRGWKEDVPLVDLLKANLARDKKSGFTQAGPHRAEIRILSDGAPAANSLSRGQTKMLVSALKLAQGKLFKQQTGSNCLFLLDDLPSELDSVHREKIGQLLYEMGVQMFLTAVELDDLKGLWGNRLPGEQKMFHVEQGSIRVTDFDGQPI